MKKCLPFVLFLLSFSVLWLDCEKDTAPLLSRQPELSLTAEDVTCTEAWLRVQTDNLLGWDVLKVSRDDSVIYTGRPGPADTLLYDTGLLPSRQYSYRASLLRNNNLLKENALCSITTLDTTSHDYNWTVDTIGTYGSVLYDVAMIDENDIWAVGEIHTPETDRYDSLGNWVPPFNAVHWDGFDWDLVRIYAVTSYGVASRGPILTAFAFSNNDIWTFSLAGSYSHYNGNIWQSGVVEQTIGSINKIWGKSPIDIYFVGTNGNITYYNGAYSYWSRIESNTDMPIQDIWGATDPISGKALILAVASPKYNWQKPLLLNLAKYPVKPEFLTVYNLLHSVWFRTPRKIFVCGGGVHYRINETWTRVEELPAIFYNRIRGSGLNNIWVVGDFGIVLHHNGVTWKEFPQLLLSTGNYEGLAVKDNLTVAVGWKGEIAIIVKNF
ncbi:MAG: hypothetical protein P8184_17175 [Calditrichia bacterium]